MTRPSRRTRIRLGQAAGGDVLGGRPTVLWALALEGLDEAGRNELFAISQQKQLTPDTLARVRELYTQAGVFEKALRLVEKHQERAEKIADEAQGEDLRRLLYYLIDTVLERPAEEEAPNVVGLSLPITTPA